MACRSHRARPSTGGWTSQSWSAGSRCCGRAGRSSIASRRRSRRSCAGPARRRTRPAPHHPPHHPHRERGIREAAGAPDPEEGALTPDGLRRHRETYLGAIRAYNDGQFKRPMRSWTLPFLIRHSADHMLDHAWRWRTRTSQAKAHLTHLTDRVTGRLWPDDLPSTRCGWCRRSAGAGGVSRRLARSRRSVRHPDSTRQLLGNDVELDDLGRDRKEVRCLSHQGFRDTASKVSLAASVVGRHRRSRSWSGRAAPRTRPLWPARPRRGGVRPPERLVRHPPCQASPQVGPTGRR